MNRNTDFKLARYEYGSVVDFCRALGISQSTFWNYVNNRERLSKDTAARIDREMARISEKLKKELSDDIR